MLNAYVSLLQCPVDAEFDDERLRLELSLTGDLFRTLRKNVVEPLLEATAFYALPFFVVRVG